MRIFAIFLLFPFSIFAAGQQPVYYSYGQAVPEGAIIAQAPEPYDLYIHGIPYVETNMVALSVNHALNDSRLIIPNLVPRKKSLARKKNKSNIPTEFPGSGDRGFWVENGSGIFAGNPTRLDLDLPDNAVGATIYAPTHMAPGACYEATTAHWRYGLGDDTSHGHGFWDHCTQGGWELFEAMDASWRAKYVRQFDGEDLFYVQVTQGADDCWSGLLYNFNQGEWEVKVDGECGLHNLGFDDGWTMWESHGLMDQGNLNCPDLPNITAYEIRIFDGGAWNYLGANDTAVLGPTGDCWTSERYSFRVHDINYKWEGITN